MSRLLRGGAVAALALAACAVSGTASAQSYGRLVVFGDSLSDNGNLFLATGGTQPPSPPYFQGRFSTGPVFTELLGFNASRFNGAVTGSINYAFGGARTDFSASPLGMRAQLANYQQRGGVFGASDLVTVLGGANNIFQGLPVAGATANPAGAIAPVSLAAATDINAIVNGVAGAGAGTILVVNLPKLSLTPQFRNTAAAPLADFAVTTFNGALLTGLNTTAAARPDTNIILMDLFKAGDIIAANPQAFGVSNVTDACFNQVTLAVCSNPNDFFYFDGVHPTAAGHRVIASLANDYLYYADRGATATLLGETAWRHREDALAAGTAAMAGAAPWASGTAVHGGLTVDRTETDARGPVSSSRSDGYGGWIGIESGTDTMRMGIAGRVAQADVEAGPMSFEVQSLSLDVYGGLRMGQGFLAASAGVASDDYNDISRVTGVGPIRHIAATRGDSVGARVQGGVWFDMGGIALSPRAAVTWGRTNVDSFFEQGVAAQLEYADRRINGVTGEVTLRAESPMGPFRLYAEGGYRDMLDDGFDPVRVGIVGNPAQRLSRGGDNPFGGQALADFGFSGDVGPAQISVGYRGRFGDSADSHMGAIKLTLPL